MELLQTWRSLYTLRFGPITLVCTCSFGFQGSMTTRIGPSNIRDWNDIPASRCAGHIGQPRRAGLPKVLTRTGRAVHRVPPRDGQVLAVRDEHWWDPAQSPPGAAQACSRVPEDRERHHHTGCPVRGSVLVKKTGSEQREKYSVSSWRARCFWLKRPFSPAV